MKLKKEYQELLDSCEGLSTEKLLRMLILQNYMFMEIIDKIKDKLYESRN